MEGRLLEEGSDGYLGRCQLLAKPQEAPRLSLLFVFGAEQRMGQRRMGTLAAIPAGPQAFSEQNSAQVPRPKGGKEQPCSLCPRKTYECSKGFGSSFTK